MKIQPLFRILSGFLSANKHNANSDKIEAGFDNTISRDGSSPNAMEAVLDMGSNRIINVGPPSDLTDAVRLQDIATLNGGGEIVVSNDWDDIVDKPSTFPSDWNTTINKPTLSADWADITDKPSTFTPSAHTHPESDITNLVSDLAGKAASSHTHTASNITDFNAAVDAEIGSALIAGTGMGVSYNAGTGETTLTATGTAGSDWNTLINKPSTFAPSSHTHPESDITSLVSDLAGKAASSHSHAQSDITGLSSSLAAKADTSHSHSYTDITSLGTGVRNALAAGTNISLNTVSGVTTITASGGGGGVPQGYIGAWEAGITTGGTPTSNTTLLNNLLSTLSAAGGGTIWFSTPGYYYLNGPVTLRTNVGIRMAPGAMFYWAGGATGNIFQTATNEVMTAGDYQINLHEGYSFTGISYNLHSHVYCRFELHSEGISPGSTMVKISCDSTAGGHYPLLTYNTAFNNYEINHMGQCSVGLWIVGQTSPLAVVTLNTFYNTWFANVAYRGIKIDRWADSNTFSGNTYIGLTGYAGVGLYINEVGSPEPSVYNTIFTDLAIDTFGSGLSRWGTILGYSKTIYCDKYFQGPVAENGDFTAASCISYQFRKAINDSSYPVGGTVDRIYIHQKGVTSGL